MFFTKTRQVFFKSRIKAVAFKAKHRLRIIAVNLIFKPQYDSLLEVALRFAAP